MRNREYVYVWANGHVEVLDQVYKVRYLGERPVFIGLVRMGDKFSDASVSIKARKALCEGGQVIELVSSEMALEGMYGALSGKYGELVDKVLICAENLKKVLA